MVGDRGQLRLPACVVRRYGIPVSITLRSPTMSTITVVSPSTSDEYEIDEQEWVELLSKSQGDGSLPVPAFRADDTGGLKRIGHSLERAPDQFEAFDRTNQSLGIYLSKDAAHRAVLVAATGCSSIAYRSSSIV